MNKLKDSGFFDFDKWIWSDASDMVNLHYHNFSVGNMHNHLAYTQEYRDEEIYSQDIFLKIVANTPNLCIRKFDLLCPEKYRNTPFYLDHLEKFQLEDGIITTVQNPANNVVTFFCIYKYQKKIYFTQTDEQLFKSISEMLSLEPQIPLVFCNSDGEILDEFQNQHLFWDAYQRMFPNDFGSKTQKLSRLIFLDEIKKPTCHKKTPYNLEASHGFRVIRFNNFDIFAVQPLLTSLNLAKGEFLKQEITDENNASFEGETSTNLPLNNITTHKKSDAEIIQELQEKIEALTEENQQLKQENITLKSLVKTPQPSAELVIEEKNSALSPPIKAPVPFLGKQGEALSFLEEHYHQYLTYFGAPKDLLFQYQLKKIDKRLYTALFGYLQYQKKKGNLVPLFAEVVPPKKKETATMSQKISFDEAFRVTNRHRYNRKIY